MEDKLTNDDMREILVAMRLRDVSKVTDRQLLLYDNYCRELKRVNIFVGVDYGNQ